MKEHIPFCGDFSMLCIEDRVVNDWLKKEAALVDLAFDE